MSAREHNVQEWFNGAKVNYSDDSWVNDPDVTSIDADDHPVAIVQGPAMVWFSNRAGLYTNENMFIVPNGTLDVFENDGRRTAQVAFYQQGANGIPASPFAFMPLNFPVSIGNTHTLHTDLASQASLQAMRPDRWSTAENYGHPHFEADRGPRLPTTRTYAYARLGFLPNDGGAKFWIYNVPVALVQSNHNPNRKVMFRIDNPKDGVVRKFRFYMSNPRVPNTGNTRTIDIVDYRGNSIQVNADVDIDMSTHTNVVIEQSDAISRSIERNLGRFIRV